ncbi:hypothetical protein M4D55_07605 [Metabacillus idriensis]|uniref:helix-turn-helix transcriptional regulator n=1 Tax=Metabacillus idriensis TaxID=324768 RepID=UPI00203E2837|nr:hypothetical protein [Metabacillus idriensis]MCM3595645.1 hypothetical protein [Metabacillus idriensis]
MENKFLERINTLYYELIIQDRLKYEDSNYFVKNRQTGKWAVAKVLKGDTISAPTSRGTSCPLANIRFMFAHPGPYTIDTIVKLAFEGELHKFFGWVNGIWTDETRRLYFKLLKESGESGKRVNEHYVKDYHNPFYRNVCTTYSGKQKYRQFLLDMGEDPDKVSGMKNVAHFVAEGRLIESEIIKQLEKVSTPFETGYRSPDNKVHPDLYDPSTNEAIDIKRHIGTSIQKEINNYQKYFSQVTVLFLMGSRSVDFNKLGVRKVSIFRWIREQDFFVKLNPSFQKDLLNGLEDIAQRVSVKLAEQDRKDFHKKLVEQIIELDKLGYNCPQIGEKVGFTYKYVHRILNGTSLREYSGSYPDIYKAKKLKGKQVPKKVKELTFAGIKVKEIAVQLGISVEMVRHHLQNQGLNEKVVMEKRNRRLVALFSVEIGHRTLAEKFDWIVNQLKSEYPHLTFAAVKTYYYSLKK